MIKVLHVELIIAAIFASIATGMFMIQARKTMADADVAVKAVSTKAIATLTDANRLIEIAGGAATEAQKASADQRKFLKNADWQVSQDLTDLHEVLQQARSTLLDVGEQADAIGTSATNAINDLVPVEQQLTEAAAGVNALANSPDIPVTLASVRNTMGSAQVTAVAVEHTAQSIEKVAAHYEIKLDANDPWYVKAWKIVSGLAEFSYYVR